jgi:hypothetical protein
MNNLLEWITKNGYVTNKDNLWYKPSEFPRMHLKHEQLIELYNQSIQTYDGVKLKTFVRDESEEAFKHFADNADITITFNRNS